LLFLSLRRPPPRSPLFPYTTLFRSCAAGAGGDHGRVHHAGTAAFVFLPGHHCPSAGLRRAHAIVAPGAAAGSRGACGRWPPITRSEEHTSELQSRENLVCRLLLEKK